MFLGMFETPHAGFVEVFDREDGGKDLYLTTLKHLEPKPLLIGQISQFRFQKRCWDLKPWFRLLGSLFLEKQMERLSCLTHQLVLKVRPFQLTLHMEPGMVMTGPITG